VQLHKDSLKVVSTSTQLNYCIRKWQKSKRCKLVSSLTAQPHAFSESTCVLQRRKTQRIARQCKVLSYTDLITFRFYTPNKSNFSAEFRLNAGLKQTIPLGPLSFDMNFVSAYELGKSVNDYYPLIIALNYSHAGKQFAMMSYAYFTKNATGDVNGAHVEKQVVLVSKHA